MKQAMQRIIDIDELKHIQVEILDYVHNYCVDKGITYFLSSGTLIGAIRHKGYIPWDDDIDLYMPRLDYERFISTFNKNEDKKFRVVALSTNRFCSFAYAKVERIGTRIVERVDNPINIGVNIDIYPVDGVPDDEKLRAHYISKIRNIRKRMLLKDVSIDFRHRSFLKNLLLLVGKLFFLFQSLRSMAEDLDAKIDKTNNTSKYVLNLAAGGGVHSCFSRDALRESILLEFEGKKYFTMIGYDEYLTKSYGDYMTPPPEEKRITHHSFIAFWE